MYSKNWGYEEFTNDIKNIFKDLFTAEGFKLTTRTDQVSYAEFKNEKVGLYFNYDNSKALLLQFKKYTSIYDYEEYDLEECCLIKKIVFKTPICEFKDQECIRKGLEYLKKILVEKFEEELLANFVYEDDYNLLKDEKYFLNEKILFLPLKDELKQRIRNIYTPNAGVEEMRNRLIKNNEYPEKFKSIYDKYLGN